MKNVIHLNLLESKEYKIAEKTVGELTAKNIIEKNSEELKEFISATAAFLQKEKEIMQNDPAFKSAKAVLKEKRQELKEATKEQKALLELAILTYSKKI